MARGMALGAFLLLAACVLLIVASISAPVTSRIYFLDIVSANSKTVFGSFGYCMKFVGDVDRCSARHVGYNIAAVSGESSDYVWVNEHLGDVSKAFILHPIAAGIAFIAFLICLVSDHIGFIFASIITFIAFVVSLVVMIIDFVVFAIIRHEINDNTNARASFANAIWIVLAATIVLFIAIFVVFFECCCGGDRHSRRSRRQDKYLDAPPMQQVGYAPQRTHWWNRRRV